MSSNAAWLLGVAALTCVASAAPLTCATRVPGTNDLYEPAINEPTCTGYRLCEADLCACLGATNGSTSGYCWGNYTGNCSVAATCLTTFFGTCLAGVINRAVTDDIDSCALWVAPLSLALLGTTAATYSGSTVQQSCRRVVCQAMTSSSKGDACATELGASDSNVCYFQQFTDAPAPPAPTPANNSVVPPPTDIGTRAPSLSGAAGVAAVMPAVVTMAVLALLL